MLLFAYGTLRNKNVQIAQFGRELAGRADALPGYRVRTLAVTDPAIAALIGQDYCATLEPSSDGEVEGVVLELTPAELAAADGYEEAAHYRRISVTLKSGVRAWAYVNTGGLPLQTLQPADADG